MLPFKVIPFVKQKDQHQSPQVSSDEDDGQPDSPPLPGIAFHQSFTHHSEKALEMKSTNLKTSDL